MKATKKEEIQKKNINLNKFIENNGSIFHSKSFLQLVGSSFHCMEVTDKNNHLLGVLPHIKTQKRGIIAYHIPPYTYQFGPIVHPDFKHRYQEIVGALLDALPPSGHYDFILFLDEQDVLPFIERGFSVSAQQTHILPLEHTINLELIHNSKRRYLKKMLNAIDNGDLVVKEGEECLKDIYNLQLYTAEKNRFNPHKKELHNLIFRLPDDSYYAHVVYDSQGNSIAGAFCPFDGKNAYHLINASKPHNNNLFNKANILSTYLAIQAAQERKLNFDFEGSSFSGIAQFYRMMGGQPRVIFRAQKSTSWYYQFLRAGAQWLKERK